MRLLLAFFLLSGGASIFAQTTPLFEDVPSYKPYYYHANLLKLRFISNGCTFVPSYFCAEEAPNGLLTRGQAAVLIIRSIYSALNGNPEGYPYSYLPQYFADVPSSHPQYVYIQKMAELGITTGCSTGYYCPDDPLNYAQIATFAMRARMVKELGQVVTPSCNGQQGTLYHYNCNPFFSDAQPSDFFFPYVQKAYELIGNDAVPPGCWYGSFCPYNQVTRGWFAIYAVRLVMNALNPSQLPNAGNLPSVQAPYNPAAGFTMTCEQVGAQNLQVTNQFVALDATHVYSQAGTSYYTAPAWPSLWMTYVRRELSGPAPPYPAIADARLGNATSVGLQSPGFSVAPGQVYTHVTKHGIVSGCISPVPSEFPQILSTQTETVTRTNQTVTTSPPGLTVSVVAQPCQGPCTYDWLIGAGIGYSVAAENQIFGGVQYQFANWSNGATSAFVYRPPSTPSTLTANYTSVSSITTITTSPPGLTVTVDGASCVTPCARVWTPGSLHTIAAVSPQILGGIQYGFVSWSDGQGQSHTITASTATYTANFAVQAQYQLTTSVSPAGGGAIVPAAGSYSPNTQVQLTAYPATGYRIQSWAGVDSYNGNVAWVTMSSSRSVTATFVLQSQPPSLPPSLSCAATPESILSGETASFEAYAQGGTPPYSYTWSGAVTGSGSSRAFQAGAPGNYTATVTVVDASSAAVQASCTLVVGEMTVTTQGYPGCGVRSLYDLWPYLFTDGTLFAHFYIQVDQAQAPLTDWTSQVVGAWYSTPTHSYGPNNGPQTTGGAPSVVELPEGHTTLPAEGFGVHGYGARYVVTNPNCIGDAGGSYAEAQVFPPPELFSLTPTRGIRGTRVADMSATGSMLLGTTDISVTGPSSIPATVYVDDDDLLTIDVDLETATAGTYNVSVTSFGASTNALTFTVGDNTPIINRIEQTVPLYAGEQGSIQITGLHFGTGCAGQPCPGAKVRICKSGETCESSDVSLVAYTSWTDTAISVQLNVGTSAEGFYDVTVVSAGSTGSGFLSTAGVTEKNESGPKATPVSGRQQAVSVKVTTNDFANGNTRVRVNAKSCAFIDPSGPQMPQIRAVIVGPDGETAVAEGTARYQVVTKFPLQSRKLVGGVWVAYTPELTVSTPTSWSSAQAAGTEWQAPFSSTKMIGGSSTLQWSYQPPGGTSVSGEFEFLICGKNPDHSVVDSVMRAGPFWFQRNIAIHETNMSMFCGGSQTAAVPHCLGGKNLGMPIWGYPAGYGFTQIDPIPDQPVDEAMDLLFNWRRNQQRGQEIIASRPGYGFWIRQVDQWSRYNLEHPTEAVPPVTDPPTNDPRIYRNNPPTPEELLKSPNCTFTISLGQGGTTTINTGSPNPAWLGDAIVMKQQGGSNPNYVSWDNTQRGAPPRWSFGKGNSVSRNIVYEFCTCFTLPAGPECQHNLKCGGVFDGVTLPRLPSCK